MIETGRGLTGRSVVAVLERIALMWRLDCNRDRPHSSLGNLALDVYALKHRVGTIPEPADLRLSVVLHPRYH